MLEGFERFLTKEAARAVREQFGTPAFVYSETVLKATAREALGFGAPYGLTVRFAMKALPNAAVLRLFDSLGLNFDASSGFEAERAMLAGIAPEKISLSTQELPVDFAHLVKRGIKVNACSLAQLERYGAAFPGSEVGLRLNPGSGSGHNNRTNTGGPGSSFGIWHEHLDQALEIASRYSLRLVRMHSHIGSGADPQVWERVTQLNLSLLRRLPDATTLNMGGGYKVARVAGEKSTKLPEVGKIVDAALRNFAKETGRELALEIEPGTYLAARAGAIVATVQDVVDTGAQGYSYLKLDAGMTEILRPSLYGAQHSIRVFPENETGRTLPYLVVGHCCESGDILTPAPGDPEGLATRELPEARIGDICVIDDAGAYCAGMAAKNYNSFPEAPEVLLQEDGSLRLIRRRQTLAQVVENEC